MSAVVGIFWHTEIATWWVNNKEQVENQTPELINQGLNQAQNYWDNQAEGWVSQFVADLTSQGKTKIDQWLAEQNLNEYGDQEGTAYTGGTPLFNEQTGQSIDRYAYLLQKFPDLVNSLNLDKYLGN